MTLEKQLEKQLPEDVKRLGGIALKFWCVSFTGMPDRMILLPGGRLVFCELKSENKRPTPRQRYVHDLLQRLGFQVWVVNTQEGYDEMIQTFKDAI